MEEKRARRLAGILILAAVIMCAFGAVAGEAEVVLVKAANICMECIGLG